MRSSTALLLAAAAAVAIPAISLAKPHGIRDEWQKGPDDDLWSARSGQAVTVFNNRLWVMGGFGHDGWYQDVWYLGDRKDNPNPDADDGCPWGPWKQAPDAPWDARVLAHAQVLGDRMLVFGGTTRRPVSDVWATKDGETWEQLTKDGGWPSRIFDASANLDDTLYIMGGEDGATRLNDVWSSKDGVTWTQVTPEAPWHKRGRMAATVFDGRIWMSGGGYWDDDKNEYVYLNDVWTTRNGKDWELVTDKADWTARCQHAMVNNENLLWVIGGDDLTYTSSKVRDVWVSRDGGKWTEATDSARWTNRGYIYATVFDEAIWILGGMKYNGGDWNFKNDVYYLPPGTLEAVGIQY